MAAKKKNETVALAERTVDAELVTDVQIAAKGLPSYKTYEEMVGAVQERLHRSEDIALRVSWEIGGHVRELMDSGKYGEHNVEGFAQELGCKPSWLYSCGRLFDVYPWEKIQADFLPKGIRPYAVAQLAEIADEEVRKQIEEKLLSGDIGPSAIGSEKTKLLRSGEDTTPTGAAGSTSSTTPPDDKTVAAAAKIRKIFDGVKETAIILTGRLAEVKEGISALDMIDDDDVNKLAMSKISDANGELVDLRSALVTACLDIKTVLVE